MTGRLRREATDYWWVKVDDRQVERLFCYSHSDAEHQADLSAFGTHQALCLGRLNDAESAACSRATAA